MVVFERVDGIPEIAFKESRCPRAVNLQREFLAVRTIVAMEGSAAPLTHRGQNFFDALLTRGTKPFAGATTRNASWRKEEIEQDLAHRLRAARELRDHRAPLT
jgi:heterodisulfide reductase subunit C